jgi:hypothetical protein
VQSLETTREASPDRSHDGEWGLASPYVAVTLGMVDGTTRTVEVGAEVADGGGTYFAVGGEPRVFIGPAGLRAQLELSVRDLRNRSVLLFDPASVRGVFVGLGDRQWHVERSQDGWRRLKPEAGPADGAVVERLLAALAAAKAATFVDEEHPADAAALATLGFDKPLLVTLLLPGGRSTTLLVAEREVKGNHETHARLAAGGPVMTVDAGLAAALRQIP